MTGELLPVKRSLIPEVVDETGRKITGPEMETVTGLVTQMAQLAQLARIRKSIEKEEFEGKIDSRTLIATDQLQWIDLIDRHPNTPWATAAFFNDGNPALPPGTNVPVHIGINDMNPFATLNTGDQIPADFTKAYRRISIIYYWCDVGNTTVVRALGKY